jgi:hypothetical protein
MNTENLSCLPAKLFQIIFKWTVRNIQKVKNFINCDTFLTVRDLKKLQLANYSYNNLRNPWLSTEHILIILWLSSMKSTNRS